MIRRHILLTEAEIALLEFFANAKHNKDLQSIVDRATAPITEQEAKYIEEARAEYEREGEIEIDDTPITSIDDSVEEGKERGAYVMAWVWVPNEDYDPDSDEDSDEE